MKKVFEYVQEKNQSSGFGFYSSGNSSGIVPGRPDIDLIQRENNYLLDLSFTKLPEEYLKDRFEKLKVRVLKACGKQVQEKFNFFEILLTQFWNYTFLLIPQKKITLFYDTPNYDIAYIKATQDFGVEEVLLYSFEKLKFINPSLKKLVLADTLDKLDEFFEFHQDSLIPELEFILMPTEKPKTIVIPKSTKNVKIISKSSQRKIQFQSDIESIEIISHSNEDLTTNIPEFLVSKNNLKKLSLNVGLSDYLLYEDVISKLPLESIEIPIHQGYEEHLPKLFQSLTKVKELCLNVGYESKELIIGVTDLLAERGDELSLKIKGPTKYLSYVLFSILSKENKDQTEFDFEKIQNEPDFLIQPSFNFGPPSSVTGGFNFGTTVKGNGFSFSQPSTQLSGGGSGGFNFGPSKTTNPFQGSGIGFGSSVTKSNDTTQGSGFNFGSVKSTKGGDIFGSVTKSNNTTQDDFESKPKTINKFDLNSSDEKGETLSQSSSNNGFGSFSTNQFKGGDSFGSSVTKSNNTTQSGFNFEKAPSGFESESKTINKLDFNSSDEEGETNQISSNDGFGSFGTNTSKHLEKYDSQETEIEKAPKENDTKEVAPSGFDFGDSIKEETKETKETEKFDSLQDLKPKSELNMTQVNNVISGFGFGSSSVTSKDAFGGSSSKTLSGGSGFGKSSGGSGFGSFSTSTFGSGSSSLFGSGSTAPFGGSGGGLGFGSSSSTGGTFGGFGSGLGGGGFGFGPSNSIDTSKMNQLSLEKTPSSIRSNNIHHLKIKISEKSSKLKKLSIFIQYPKLPKINIETLHLTFRPYFEKNLDSIIDNVDSLTTSSEDKIPVNFLNFIEPISKKVKILKVEQPIQSYYDLLRPLILIPEDAILKSLIVKLEPKTSIEFKKNLTFDEFFNEDYKPTSETSSSGKPNQLVVKEKEFLDLLKNGDFDYTKLISCFE